MQGSDCASPSSIRLTKYNGPSCCILFPFPLLFLPARTSTHFISYLHCVVFSLFIQPPPPPAPAPSSSLSLPILLLFLQIFQELYDVLEMGQSIIFCRTKMDADIITNRLNVSSASSVFRFFFFRHAMLNRMLWWCWCFFFLFPRRFSCTRHFSVSAPLRFSFFSCFVSNVICFPLLSSILFFRSLGGTVRPSSDNGWIPHGEVNVR